MSRKFILHIGSHKTGTSSIQAALYENRHHLEQNGLSLFFESDDGEDREDGHPGGWTRPFPDPIHGATISAMLADKIATLPGDVIMCLENFSWVFSPKELTRFQGELRKHFDEIQIIVYLRRQDQLMVSHHQQASKEWRFMPARLFGNSPTALPEISEGVKLYCDYNTRLGLWADAFGAQQITIRVFEKEHLIDGDAVKDFASVIGHTLPIDPGHKNESHGFIRAKVGHLMNQRKYERSHRKWLNGYLDNSGKLLPSRDQAERFYAQFETSNCELNEQFKISEKPSVFSTDFSMYPNGPADQWSEELADLAIGNLLQAYSYPMSFRPADGLLLDQMIETLKKSHPQDAWTLAKLFGR
ncbi:MAG: hypothetical protein AAF699_03955 [Pseudomonadota bacterium]